MVTGDWKGFFSMLAVGRTLATNNSSSHEKYKTRENTAVFMSLNRHPLTNGSVLSHQLRYRHNTTIRKNVTMNCFSWTWFIWAL